MSLLEKNSVLKSMYETGLAVDGSPMHSHLPQSYAEALFQAVLSERPITVVEVGMAMGTSSLAILSALRETGGGRLVSIDPMQTSGWNGRGVAAIAAAGLADRHELIEDFDYRALPRLLDSGLQIDFAYIDGWHTFDYTLLDWWYIDRMLPARGVVVFNDCSWPAVDKAIRFVQTHRKYEEMDVGLPRVLTPKGDWLDQVKRRLPGGEPRRRSEDRYFRKKEAWEPSWDFFAPF